MNWFVYRSSKLRNALSRRELIKLGGYSSLAIATMGLSKFSFAENVQPIKGSLAPELEVPYWIDGNGKQTEAFSVHANKGKWIYIKCFQDWCPTCHSIGFPNLQKLLNAFPDNDKLTAVAIQTTFEGHSTNTKSALRKNQLNYDLNIPFGHDPSNLDVPDDQPEHFPSTMIKYQTRGTPWVSLIHPNGRVVYSNFHINMDMLIDYLKEQGV